MIFARAAGLFAAAVVCAIHLSSPGPAGSHSLLLSSSPPAGGTLTVPATVVLTFNNRIEKKLSTLRLVPPSGKAMPAVVEAGGAPERLAAVVPAIAPGPYHVEWQVLSADGHVVNGRFPITVAAPER